MKLRAGLGPLLTIPDEDSGPEFVKSPRTRTRHKFDVPLDWERYWDGSSDVRVEERSVVEQLQLAAG